ncbi:hypothetical protein BKA64DRAFT_213628 [Cadophora sp. MPI-SDFR-AT-0126]|nr:hypothetical protein BKA64DRAFT_213628 [Leotiomycetes sp. MPI-SDFR-AT-0126]
MHLLHELCAFVLLLVNVHASPLPESGPVLPSIFHNPSLKPLDNFGADLFNLSGLTKAPKSPRDLEKRFTLPALLCNVVFNGVNQGNPQGFTASGQILITAGVPTNPTINGINPTDVALAIGPTDPMGGRPLAGDLRYTTNRALGKFVGGATPIFYDPYDFAYITSTSTSVTAVLDTSTAPLNRQAYFDISSNVWDPGYKVISGGFTIKIGANNAITGKLNFVGDSSLVAGRRPYNAIITGKVAAYC